MIKLLRLIRTILAALREYKHGAKRKAKKKVKEISRELDRREKRRKNLH